MDHPRFLLYMWASQQGQYVPTLGSRALNQGSAYDREMRTAVWDRLPLELWHKHVDLAPITRVLLAATCKGERAAWQTDGAPHPLSSRVFDCVAVDAEGNWQLVRYFAPPVAEMCRACCSALAADVYVAIGVAAKFGRIRMMHALCAEFEGLLPHDIWHTVATEAAQYMVDYPIVSLRLFATDIGFHRALVQTGAALTLPVIHQLHLFIEEKQDLKAMCLSLLHLAVSRGKEAEGDALLSLLVPMASAQDILMIQSRIQQAAIQLPTALMWVDATCLALEVIARLIPLRVSLKQARNMLSKHKDSVALAVRELRRDTLAGVGWRRWQATSI